MALAPARSFVNGFDEAIAFIHYAFIFWIPLGSSSSCGHCIQITGIYCWHDVIPLRHICMRIASSQRCYLFQGILCTFYVVSSVPFGVYDMHNHMQCCNIKSCSSASAVSVQSVVFSKLITGRGSVGYAALPSRVCVSVYLGAACTKMANVCMGMGLIHTECDPT